MNRVDVSNRLLLAGLNNTEITTELALFDSLSASNQALYFDWMEEVSNADIATQVRSGNPARIPPTYTHDQEDNPTPSGASPLLRSLVVGTDPTVRAAGLLQMRWVTTTQPTAGLPQTNDEWQNPTTDTLQRWTGSVWSLVNRTAYAPVAAPIPAAYAPSLSDADWTLIASGGALGGAGTANLCMATLAGALYFYGSNGSEPAGTLAGVRKWNTATDALDVISAAPSPGADFNRFYDYGAVEYRGKMYIGDRRGGQLYQHDGAAANYTTVAILDSGEDVFPGPVVWDQLWLGSFGGGADTPPRPPCLYTWDGSQALVRDQYVTENPGGEVLSIVPYAGKLYVSTSSNADAATTGGYLYCYDSDLNKQTLVSNGIPMRITRWGDDLIGIPAWQTSPALYVWKFNKWVPINSGALFAGSTRAFLPHGDTLFISDNNTGHIVTYKDDTVTALPGTSINWPQQYKVFSGYLWAVTSDCKIYRRKLSPDALHRHLSKPQRSRGGEPAPDSRLISPDGSVWRQSIDNTGAVTTAKVTSPTYTYSDTFTRANSASTIGTADTGQAWTTLTTGAGAGTWGINGNQAYVVAGGVPGTSWPPARGFNTGSGNFDMSVNVVIPSDPTQIGGDGLIFNYVDANNYWQLRIINNGLELWKIVAGVATNVWSVTGFGTRGGQKRNLRVKRVGSSIDIYTDGYHWPTVTDAALASNTSHGIEGYGSSATAGLRFDDFKIV